MSKGTKCGNSALLSIVEVPLHVSRALFSDRLQSSQ